MDGSGCGLVSLYSQRGSPQLRTLRGGTSSSTIAAPTTPDPHVPCDGEAALGLQEVAPRAVGWQKATDKEEKAGCGDLASGALPRGQRAAPAPAEWTVALTKDAHRPHLRPLPSTMTAVTLGG